MRAGMRVVLYLIALMLETTIAQAEVMEVEVVLGEAAGTLKNYVMRQNS